MGEMEEKGNKGLFLNEENLALLVLLYLQGSVPKGCQMIKSSVKKNGWKQEPTAVYNV